MFINFRAVLAKGLAIILLVGCSGNTPSSSTSSSGQVPPIEKNSASLPGDGISTSPGGTGAPGTNNPPAVQSPPARKIGSATFVIKIPSLNTSSFRTAHISPGTKSFEIKLEKDLSPIANFKFDVSDSRVVVNIENGKTVYTVKLSAPVGTHIFSVSLFDALNAVGNVLARWSGPVTIDPDSDNTVTIITEGVISKIDLTLAPSPTPFIGTVPTIDLYVDARDATNQIIMGTYSQVIDLSTDDPRVTLSAASIADSSTLVSATYNGVDTGLPIKLSASASEVVPANVTPAILTPKRKPPVMTAILPESGTIGTTVHLTGSDMQAAASVTVFFNQGATSIGTRPSTVNAQGTELDVSVPNDINVGDWQVSLRNDGLTPSEPSGSKLFKVAKPTLGEVRVWSSENSNGVILDLQGQPGGRYQDRVLLVGGNFSPVLGHNTVIFTAPGSGGDPNYPTNQGGTPSTYFPPVVVPVPPFGRCVGANNQFVAEPQPGVRSDCSDQWLTLFVPSITTPASNILQIQVRVGNKESMTSNPLTFRIRPKITSIVPPYIDSPTVLICGKNFGELLNYNNAKPSASVTFSRTGSGATTVPIRTGNDGNANWGDYSIQLEMPFTSPGRYGVQVKRGDDTFGSSNETGTEAGALLFDYKDGQRPTDSATKCP